MTYSALIKKIDDFIRKYYLNKIIRGSIFMGAIFLISFLCLILSEYLAYFNVGLKTFFFYSFIIINLLIFWVLVGKYLSAYLKLSKTINHQEASEIIGKHFPEIGDKLNNTLQLNNILHNNPQHQQIIEASINQRIVQMQPIPFVNAIKISENKKYAKYIIIPIMIILLIAFLAPVILKDGTMRMIKYKQEFTKKAPFNFIILNNSLQAGQGDDYLLKLKLSGEEIPQDIYLEDGNNSFKLNKEDIINFNHLFKNLQNDRKFRFKAGRFYSNYYKLNVIKKTALVKLTVTLNYPPYLKKKNETLGNPGDLNIPEGTILKWQFNTENSTSLNLKFDNQNINLKPKKENSYIYEKRLLKSTVLSIQSQNNELKQTPIIYQLRLIPDAYPQIDIQEKTDSLNTRVLYFTGISTDDYGLNKLNFHYQIIQSPDKTRIGKSGKSEIKINTGDIHSSFFYFWSLNNTEIEAGEEVSYYFEVSDLDGVNGPKSTKSEKKYYKLSSKEESLQQIAETNNSIKEKINSAAKQAKSIQQEAQKIQQEILSNSKLDYTQEKLVEQLLDKQQKLEELLKEISEESNQNLLENKQIDIDKELLEKQEQIQNLFDNVLNEKTKELLKELQKLIDQKQENLSPNAFKDIQTDHKSLEKELDRILELYKKLEIEQKIDQSVQQLKDLAEKQTETNKINDLKTQQEITKKFSDIKSALEEAQKKNELLDQPTKFNNPEELQNDLEKTLKATEQAIKDGKKQQAHSLKENSAQKMLQLANDIEKMQQDIEEEENKISQQELRQLLQNLLRTSFDQEKLMLSIKITDPNDPKLTELGRQQRNIKDNLKMVEDSLYSLSKRVPQISTTVNKEIAQINQQIIEALENITERKIALTNRNQQYALTSINNLTLFLSEALQNLQNAMKNAKSGGKGKPQSGMAELSKMQKELNENMQKVKEEMNQQGLQQGSKQMSRQFSEMAKQQEMIRRSLQDINQRLNKDGNSKLGNLEKIIQEMEQTETDLVNKKITQESLLRQTEIQSRLLDAEKAERERELDQQKESKSGKNFAPNYNLMLKEYIKSKEKEVEMQKTVSPVLNDFYKSKISEYFKKINSGE